VENQEEDLVCAHHLLDASYVFAELLDSAPDGTTIPRWTVLSTSADTATFVLFFIFAIGEEVGWTGYVTDPLQDRWSALTSSIVLGLVTAIWHSVPLIQMGRTPIWIAWWSVSAVSIRLLTVWLYNSTGKSLFAAIVFHSMNNLSFALFPNYGSHWDPAVAGVITEIVAVIVTFLWGPRTLARYRYG
jgi:uncharacterized protein